MSRGLFFQVPLLVSVLLGVTRGDDWPQWRGPEGTGVSREAKLPLLWTAERGLAWKTELPEWGTSSPIVSGDSVFVTTQRDQELLLLRIDKRDGRTMWTKLLGSGQVERIPLRGKTADERREQKFHQLQNMASPTPAADGRTVVAHFGNGDLVACDFDGKELWRRNLQVDFGGYTIWWGHANSPIIHNGLVISACVQDSLADVAQPAASYLVAHDLATGEVRWRTLRMTGAPAEEGDAYTTPLACKAGDYTQLIVMGGNQVDAYEPAGGKQLWKLANIVGSRTVGGPTAGHGLVFVTQGKSGPLSAVRLDGSGEISKRQVAWRHELGTPDSCSPVIWGDHLFVITDGGVVRCFDAHRGQVQWTQRIPGDYKASPVAADGRIYFLNTTGTCTVVAAGSRFEKLAENRIDDETLASPAVSDGRIYIRGRKALYCLE